MEQKRERERQRKRKLEKATAKAKAAGVALLTAAELSVYGVPVGTIYRMVRLKQIPYYRVGVTKRGGIRFNRDEVMAALRPPVEQPAANESQATTTT